MTSWRVPVVVALAALAAACAGVPAGHGEAIAINVLVKPDAALAARALALNARLRVAYPAGFALGEGHAPHLTVLQRYVRRAELDAALAAVARVVARSSVPGATLQATGLYAAPFAGLGMAAIRVAPSPALLALQADLVAALAPFTVASAGPEAFAPEPGGAPVNEATVAYVRDFVPRSSGVRYVPHVTVGVGAADAVATIVAAPFAPAAFRAERVAVFQLGDFGTARRRLWDSADAGPGLSRGASAAPGGSPRP